MPNDVFIAFKNLDVKGAPTRDLEIARDVYEFLTTRGLKVFFSVVTLEDLGISAYKNAIDQALDSASVLVAIGTSADNLNSTWVSYEWDSFYNDILSGIKPNGRVFTYIEGMTVAALPRALRQTQTFLHSAASLQRLFNFIIKTLPAPEGSRTLPAQNKERVRPETKKLEKVSERSAAQNYRYHVFISYARVYDALTGWVSSFKQGSKVS